MRRCCYRLAAYFLGGVLAGGTYLPAQPPPLRAKIKAGVLEGARWDGGKTAAAFLGIPYAASPVGELRWKPPQAAKAWSGVREAKQYGAAWPQLPARWFPDIGWSEDCLYLNVWTPQLATDARLPVLVYLHGGSNTQGYSQMTPLGPSLASLGVVVVSANYRLGPFGFLAHSALTAESPHHSSGNYGLLDQLQALQWVKENIQQFGGDPGRVTVMGQSSGAVDVCLLMSSPLSAGLMQGAIMQSGDCQGTLNEDIRTPVKYNLISGSGEAVGERLANDLGIAESPDTAAKLRALAADKILQAWRDDPQIHFDAIVDGWVVPMQPAAIFAAGRQLRVPVIAGSNADEATVFGHPGPQTAGQFRDYVRADTGSYSDEESQAYPTPSDADVAGQYLQLQSDTFAYGAYSMAQATARAGQKAYLYYFTYREAGKRAHLGAYHGLELYFLSNNFPADWQQGRDEEALGRELRGYWVQFAKTGNPNAVGLPMWPAFDSRSDQRLELGRAVRVGPIPAQLSKLEDIMRAVIAEVSRK